MARHPHGLPRREIGVGLGQQTFARLAQCAQFIREDFGVAFSLHQANLDIDLRHRFLKIQRHKCCFRHQGHSSKFTVSKRANNQRDQEHFAR